MNKCNPTIILTSLSLYAFFSNHFKLLSIKNVKAYSSKKLIKHTKYHETHS